VGSDRDEHLDDLVFHWGSAYLIAHPEPDVWIAVRRDTHETLRAGTPVALRDLILADYAARPVPRGCPG
jgi:hypothetical protein